MYLILILFLFSCCTADRLKHTYSCSHSSSSYTCRSLPSFALFICLKIALREQPCCRCVCFCFCLNDDFQRTLQHVLFARAISTMYISNVNHQPNSVTKILIRFRRDSRLFFRITQVYKHSGANCKISILLVDTQISIWLIQTKVHTWAYKHTQRKYS